MSEPEVINLSNISDDTAKPNMNFGGGIELLMNEKRKSDSKHEDVGNIDLIEKELEELKDLDDIEYNPEPPAPTASSSSKPNLFSDIGKQTANQEHVSSTWDGFEKLNANNIPDIPEAKPQLSKEDLLREKFQCLRRLEELEKKGVKLTKQYSMESNLSEMQGEYETIMAEKERSNSIKFQAKILMACITGVEFLNNKFDPFDIKLDGWSEQMHENITDYDEVFAELHEKYKSKGKMAPELKLMFQLAGSAMMIHMTNTMFKTSVPGMDDIMKQNPELMQQFTKAAAASMSDSRPGFSNFMNSATANSHTNMMPNMSTMNDDFIVNDGIQITETNHDRFRQEMRGPTDVSEIISNMKTKMQVDAASIQELDVEDAVSTKGFETDKSSNISIHDLKELAGQKMPRKNKKKSTKTETVSVSLDI